MAVTHYGYLFVALSLGGPSLAQAAAEDSVHDCQKVVRLAGQRYVNNTLKTVEKCLERASAYVIDNGGSIDDAASVCVRSFLKLYNSADPTKTIEAKFRAQVAEACDPSINAELEHTASQVLGIGTRDLHASTLGTWCAWFGGDGSIDSIDEWTDCLVAGNACSAQTALSVHFPRALEWLTDMEVTLNAQTPPPADALVALVAVRDALEGGDSDQIVEQRCGASLFPATGQTTAYTAIRTGAGSPSAVDEDGTLRVGTTLRYIDNGDGTIRDQNTGLMWEKKVTGDGVPNPANLHDADNSYVWSEVIAMGTDSIWDWLDDVNAEGGVGFAGHSDWRVPNLKELQSIVDYENENPAVHSIFHDPATCATCSDITEAACTCTDAITYWSSTTRKPNTAQAWNVDFSDGAISGNGKGGARRVRAVRLGH